MSFANPYGLLGLAALPVILAIHLYQQRFPPLKVAGLHLWAAESEVRLAGRRRDRLPITSSLLLELLAALLMTLVISQPRFGELDKVTHLVVVLDDSASMMGGAPGEATFRDRAVAALQNRVDSLERNSVVTLILTGPRPTMLAGPAVPWSEAQTRLAQWQPHAIRHDFAPAWELARQVAESTGQLLFLTDHIPKEGFHPDQLEIASFGAKLNNVAVTTAVWEFDAETGTGQIYLRLTNLGNSAVEARVKGTAGELNVFEKTLHIPEDGKSAVEATVPGGLGTLNIAVESTDDGLALDNRIVLVEPKVRTVRIAAQTNGETTRELLHRSLSALPNVELDTATEADLTISAARELPVSDSRVWWLGLGPLDPSKEARSKARNLVGPYVIEKDHPLLEGVVLAGVIWGGVQETSLEMTPLISAGRFPLLAQLNGTRATAYVANVDLEQSNLGESPDWPILISNLIELRRADLPGLNRWNYRQGEAVRFRLYNGEESEVAEAAGETLVLLHEGESKQLARMAMVDLSPPSSPGLYEIRDGKKSFGKFAVNYQDAEESDLRGLFPGNRPPVGTDSSANYLVDPKYSWVLIVATALVVLALLINWWVLRLGSRSTSRLMTSQE